MNTELVCLSHFAAEPHFNMAFDEWMLSEAIAHPGHIAVRLYTWGRGCITFGYNQRQETAVNVEQLGNTPLIRRITGGRALLHDPSELTYSVAMHESAGSDVSQLGSVTASSGILAGILVDFLRRIGIQSDYARQSTHGNGRPEFFHKAPCFASHARHEVISDRGKLIASAQRRIDGAILQHGAIKIGGVSAHPALPLPDGNQLPANKLVSVDETQFLRFKQIFFAAFSDYFGLPPGEGRIEGEAQEQIRRRADRIKENPVARRDYFKQSSAQTSLLDA